MTDSLYQLTLTRLRLFFREPAAIFWAFGFPLLLTVALGIAFRNRPPEPVRVAVLAGPGAEALVADLQRSPEIVAAVMGEDAAAVALRAGKVALIVDGAGPLAYRFDAARPESRLARALVDAALQRAAGRADPLPVTEIIVAEPGSRYVDFLLPGLIGLNIMSNGMWGIGFVIVEERTKKLLKRMLATPMRRREFLLSFILMRMVFLLVELPVLLLFGWLTFSVTVHGSWLLLLAVALFGALAFAGIGLLVGSRAQNIHTVSGLMNLVILPMFVCSGVFFSSANFPDAAQPFIRALPLTALNDALRAVMNEGAGLAAVAPQLAVLAVIAVVSFAVALKIFRWN